MIAGSKASGASEAPGEAVSATLEAAGDALLMASATCPPHYWIISREADRERWDCRSCAATKTPAAPRFVTWGERSCTWTREERILAGVE
jgi:hypothetical protein